MSEDWTKNYCWYKLAWQRFGMSVAIRWPKDVSNAPEEGILITAEEAKTLNDEYKRRFPKDYEERRDILELNPSDPPPKRYTVVDTADAARLIELCK